MAHLSIDHDTNNDHAANKKFLRGFIHLYEELHGGYAIENLVGHMSVP